MGLFETVIEDPDGRADVATDISTSSSSKFSEDTSNSNSLSIDSSDASILVGLEDLDDGAFVPELNRGE